MRLIKNGISKRVLTLLFFVIACWSIHMHAQDIDTKYQRCSVISMMIEHPMYMFNEEMANAFRRIPLSPRFNNHGLGVNVVKFATQEFADQQSHISSFTVQTKLGNRAVAKWFNWNKATGMFNMELVKERGLYNANALEREMASLSVRGSAILQDAGEQLIPNTYLLMHDVCYTGDYSVKEAEMNSVGKKRRFDVKVTSYIFRLDWGEEKMYDFYSKYYNGCPDFINSATPYRFLYRAKVETDYGESSPKVPQTTLIERVVARCLDINIAKLQRSYPDFRIKALITSVDPLQADVGMKEGVSEKSIYEVLEMSIDENGIAKYNRVGTIKPVVGKIWDNRYMASEEGTLNSNLGYTTFEKISGKDFYPGMLIREIE